MKTLIFSFAAVGLVVGTAVGLVWWQIPVEVDFEIISDSGVVSHVPGLGYADLASALGMHPFVISLALGMGGAILSGLAGLTLALFGYRLGRGRSDIRQ